MILRYRRWVQVARWPTSGHTGLICWPFGVPDVVWDTAQVLVPVKQPTGRLVKGEVPLELPPELLLEPLELPELPELPELLEPLELLELLELVLTTYPPLELLMPVVTATLEPLLELVVVVVVEVVTMVDVPVALVRSPTALLSVVLTLTKKPGWALPLTNVIA
jgi:hypothetical protein